MLSHIFVMSVVSIKSIDMSVADCVLRTNLDQHGCSKDSPVERFVSGYRLTK